MWEYIYYYYNLLSYLYLNMQIKITKCCVYSNLDYNSPSCVATFPTSDKDSGVSRSDGLEKLSVIVFIVMLALAILEPALLAAARAVYPWSSKNPALAEETKARYTNTIAHFMAI